MSNNNNMTNQEFIKQINEMVGIDQELRFKTKPGRELGNFLVYAIDAVHNYKAKNLINKFGYPRQKTIGKEAMHNFWLLIQHQDYDTDLQKMCLKKCDFDSIDEAFLTDRIMIKEKGKQLYGTQFRRMSDNKRAPFPIIKPKEIDKRRRKMGLDSMEEEIKRNL